MTDKHTIVSKIAILVCSIAAVAFAATAQAKDLDTILRELGGEQRGPASSGVATKEKSDAPPSSTVPILFDHDSASVSSASLSQVAIVAQALRDGSLADYRFRIEGHTDQTGTSSYNQDLSERRAAAVRRLLVDTHGIAASRLVSRGYGESQPLRGVSQVSETGRAKNRRVVVVRLGGTTAGETAATRPGHVPSGQPDGPRADAAVQAQTPAESVTIRLQQRGEAAAQLIRPGGVLRTDDEYRVSFEAAKDSYIYLFQFDSSGNSQALFPNSDLAQGSNPVRAGRTYDVPEGSGWLTLDGAAGEETIVALASQKEIPNPTAAALQALSRGPRAPVPLGGNPATPDLSVSTFTFQHQ